MVWCTKTGIEWQLYDKRGRLTKIKGQKGGRGKLGFATTFTTKDGELVICY